MLRGGAWVSLAQILGVACATGSQLLLARLLTPEALGGFYLIQSVVIPAAQLSQLGMVRPLTRIVAQAAATGEGARVPDFIRAAHVLALAAGLVVALLYLLAGDWLARAVFAAPVMAQGTLLAASWTLAINFQQVSAGVLRGLHRVGMAAFVAESGAKILMAAGLALLLALGGMCDLSSALAIAVGAAWLMAALGLVRVVPSAIRRAPVYGGAYGELMAASLPLVLTGVVQVALNVADLWVMGARFTAEEVALYGAAKRLILIVSLPLMMLPLVIPPVIADLHARGEHQRLQRVIRGATTLSGIPAVLMLLVFVVGSEFVLGVAFGEFYRAASMVLVLLCIERLVFVWVGPCTLTLLMTGHERAVMKITTTMGFATVALVFAGAFSIGFVGVAAGFVVGSSAHQLIAWHAVRRLVGIRTNMTFSDLPEAVRAAQRSMKR